MAQYLQLKSIKDILGYKFFIPSYQRGYRWEERQVLDLLEDIYEFANKSKSKDEFYCLQPVVVREKDGKYRVIDGQQRLTTIYIILKYLKESSEKFKELKENYKDSEIFEYCDIDNFEVTKIYNIEYETRKNDCYNNFLEKKSKDINNSNPDFYYMSEAYQTIKEWFKSKNKKLFLDTLLNDTKFIWYIVECNDEEDEIAIFTRLNIGKIPLTNAELIKAMLLLPIKDYKEQIEFSTRWDAMEQNLQKNDFWYFLSNARKSETAIDVIFHLLAQKYQKEYKAKKVGGFQFKESDNNYAYYIFAYILNSGFKNEKEIWKDTNDLYRMLLNWYNDREIYHKVGYLIHFNKKLLDLYDKFQEKTKDQFKNDLDETIKNRIEDVNLFNLNYSANKEIIREVLLLFNIETILQNPNSNVRFDFFHFKYIENDGELKERKWDIEHIASQTDNENKEEWVKTVFKYIKGKDIKTDEKKIKNVVKKFECFQNKVKKELKIQEPIDELKDNIGNLTLLDSKTNRSYKNAFFPIKRAIIIEEDSKGDFIPICTKNVFLKQYSNKIKNMMNWTDDDVKSYRDAIYQMLKKYGIKCEEQNDESIAK